MDEIAYSGAGEKCSRDVFEREAAYRRDRGRCVWERALLLLVVCISIGELELELEGMRLVLFCELGHNI